MMTTDEMPEKLYTHLHQLKTKKIIRVMYAALDEMQRDNKKTKLQCVSEALGYKETEPGKWQRIERSKKGVLLEDGGE